MTKQSPLARRIGAILGSRKFFWGTLAFFALEAVWIALSGLYPMAFDEDFHLGIIRLYAHHISPFWSGQPPGADALGAVARDPSYLYHYLMSFPYRVIDLFTHDQTIQVLWLRAINIALFGAGLVIYRRLLLKTGASRAIVNTCLMLFILIPAVPLLAAQINYDNLFFPLVGLVLLLTLRFGEELKRGRVNGRLLIGLLTLCLLTSLVKYAFLPIFAAVVIYLTIRLRQLRVPGFRTNLAGSFRPWLSRPTLLIVLALVISGALFAERYGVNLVRYHTPVPDCGQVLTVKQCSAYGPWIRDYNFEINKVDEDKNPLVFTGDWFYGMWLRLFFAVDGPATDFQTKGPLLVPALSGIIFTLAGFLAALGYWQRLFRIYRAPVLGLFALTAAMYVGVLWLDEFRAYIRTGQPVAINGRYLFPVLLFVMLAGALAVNELCRRRNDLKLAVAGLAVVSLLWGGGALTYILRSQPNWYWPSPVVRSTNQALQRTIGPVTPGYRQEHLFMR